MFLIGKFREDALLTRSFIAECYAKTMYLYRYLHIFDICNREKKLLLNSLYPTEHFDLHRLIQFDYNSIQLLHFFHLILLYNTYDRRMGYIHFVITYATPNMVCNIVDQRGIQFEPIKPCLSVECALLTLSWSQK